MSSGNKGLNVLIIDDELLVINRLDALLLPYPDLTVKAKFTNPIKALDFLAEDHIDLVFVDLHMPVIDGVEFLSRVWKVNNRFLEIIFLLSASANQRTKEAIEISQMYFLIKPFEMINIQQLFDRMQANKNETCIRQRIETLLQLLN